MKQGTHRIYSRKNRQLFLLALTVLTRYNGGKQPTPRDLIILRRHAGAEQTQLPVDELCCTLIERELEAA